MKQKKSKKKVPHYFSLDDVYKLPATAVDGTSALVTNTGIATVSASGTAQVTNLSPTSTPTFAYVSTSGNLGAIIGGVIGGVIGLAIVSLLFFKFCGVKKNDGNVVPGN